MATTHDHRINVHGATLTRRQFVKTGGALIVGFSLAGRSLWDKTAEARRLGKFARCHARELVVRDSRRQHILMRTGKVDFGQSTRTRRTSKSSPRS